MTEIERIQERIAAYHWWIIEINGLRSLGVDVDPTLNVLGNRVLDCEDYLQTLKRPKRGRFQFLKHIISMH